MNWATTHSTLMDDRRSPALSLANSDCRRNVGSESISRLSSRFKNPKDSFAFQAPVVYFARGEM
jgi:hypothetical protein